VNHRQIGVDLFNEVWRLMESREDDDRMLHAAHASASARCRQRARELGEEIAGAEDREHLDQALVIL
jgi:hypothetical protein